MPIVKTFIEFIRNYIISYTFEPNNLLNNKAMKKILLTLSAVILVVLVNAQTTEVKQEEQKGEITFATLEHNYGTVEYDSNGTCVFEFTNTGKVVLTLKNVQASCGCTVPEWSREPINPGEKGKITVKYNTKNVGNFQKNISVYSNAITSPVVLTIRGEVKPQTAQQQQQPVK
jgi:hypothetical protein